MDLQLSAPGKLHKAGKLALNDGVFAQDLNETLIHQILTAYMAGGRAGTKAQKNRSAVSGGGRKPWRQKGTGNARAGTIRSPIWVGGGKTFAAKPRDFKQKVNKKMYKAALRSIMSELARQQRIIAVESFAASSAKTKDLLAQLAGFETNNVLIVVEEVEQNLQLASRNIPYVEVRDVEGVDPVSLVKYEHVLVTTGALKKIEERLA